MRLQKILSPHQDCTARHQERDFKPVQGSWQQFGRDSKHRVLLQILLPGLLACVHSWALGRTQQTNLEGP